MGGVAWLSSVALQALLDEIGSIFTLLYVYLFEDDIVHDSAYIITLSLQYLSIFSLRSILASSIPSSHAIIHHNILFVSPWNKKNI
jgi:hypothetical protein